MRNAKHLMQCQQCASKFRAVRSDAKFCSAKCRLAFYQSLKRGNGKSWHFVREDYKAWAMELKAISPKSYETIATILSEFGAIVCEYAIFAAIQAANDCIVIQEAVRQ